MLGPLPGGSTTPDAITDLQLLNGLDQIRDAAIFSPKLDEDIRKNIVEATALVKSRTTLPSASLEPNWKSSLLSALSKQVADKIMATAELDDETGNTVLKILNPYVPEKDRHAEQPD